MSRHPLQLSGDQLRLPVVVVDAVDHSVLKADAPSGFPEVPVAGGKQLLHIIRAVHRHDAAARLAVRRVERHRQRQLQLLFRQCIDPRHHAAGGQTDVPHADIQPVGAVDQLQEAQHVVHVVQRLADAHEHDVGHGQAAVQLGEKHLIQQLGGAQIPHLSGNGAGAEGAPHAAAHLRGDAHRVAVVVLHQHRLDAVAVGQLPQVLNGAVQPGCLLPRHRGRGDEARLRQLRTQRLG